MMEEKRLGSFCAYLCELTDQKYLESFEMWCWGWMEKISWTDQVRNKEVLLKVNEQRNILHEIKNRRPTWLVISYVENAF